MNLKTLDPRITLKLLEGYRDTISPMAAEQERFYQNQLCPCCDGTSFTKTGNASQLFRHGQPLPRYQLRCNDCDCVFDPHSGIVLTMGNRAKAYVPTIPLLEGPED